MANSKTLESTSKPNKLHSSASDALKTSCVQPGATGNAQMSQPKLPLDSVSTESYQQNPADGFFSNTTKKFGSWLTKFTDGEKVNISSKDLNAFAPTSF